MDMLEELRKIEGIGVHEHCRDGKLSYKSTIAEVMKIAKTMGLAVICDMPNTDPPVVSEEVLLERIAIAEKSRDSGVKYYVYIGLTADPEQIKQAVYLWKKYPVVVGLKMFAGSSTGNLAIIDLDKQRIVYETLTKSGYNGVIAVHCEKESLLRPERFYPDKPWTWAEARPGISEVKSIGEQIYLAEETSFPGHLHVCHISTQKSVEIIDKARKKEMRISCGITPHHLIYSVSQMEKLGGTRGRLLKCNPPIRDEDNRQGLIQDLKEGKIDLIETDHAPHTVSDKIQKHASGVMSLLLMPRMYVMLREYGFTEEQLTKLLRKNALKIFGKIKV